jgi:hypothetical protein
VLAQPENITAAFLLTRGPFSWLGRLHTCASPTPKTNKTNKNACAPPPLPLKKQKKPKNARLCPLAF